MDLEQRIEQFRNMAEADPDNEMAHFSLGNALLQAGRPEEAAESLRRCIEVNPDMSKAYQLAGQALHESGNRDDAVRVLTAGYEIAAARGDVLPRDAMADQLRELDAPVPEVAVAEPPAGGEAPDGSFICAATGRPGTPMDKAPFRGPLGARIGETISQETWRMWIEQGTKVINELRLDLSRDDHQRMYDQHMIEFLGLEAWVAENMPDRA